MVDARWELPHSWQWASAEEVAQIVGGGTPSTLDETNFATVGVPWITPSDLTRYSEAYISRGARDLSEDGYRASGARLIPAGSVLFSSRAPIGYCVIAANDLSTNQGFKSLVLEGGNSPEFFRYYLLASKEYAESLSSGTTFKELSGTRMAQIAIPVAPIAEQRRIVRKLDQLISRTARARADLGRVPSFVAKYKQALLATAFSGTLTQEWRSRGRRSPQPKLDAKGVDGRAAALERLPENWAWTSIDRIAVVTGGLTKNSKRERIANRVPYLRVANVYANELRLDDIAEIGCSEAEFAKTRLSEGDLLIVEGNGSLEQIGRVAIWNGEIDACSHQNHLIRARVNNHAIPQFVLYWLLSPIGRLAIEKVASSSSGLHTLSITKVEGLPVPM